MDLLSLLTAFGLGSIATAVIQAFLKRRSDVEDRRFEERKEAYIGLLQAYHRAAVDNDNKAGKEFAYWQMRCELVAPAPVRRAIEEIIASNDDRAARQVAHERLKSELRADLGVTPS